MQQFKKGDLLYCHTNLGRTLKIGNWYQITHNIWTEKALDGSGDTRIITVMGSNGGPIKFEVDNGTELYSRWLMTEECYERNKKLESLLNL